MSSSVTSSTGQLDYRPELDGLRCFAVFAVIIFHSLAVGGPSYRGGFHGVDVFFVLSGYLITTLLVREWGTTGTIKLGNFYARRGLRLLPGLFVLLALGAVLAIVVFPGKFPRPYWQSALAAVSYVANWIEWRGPITPLSHTWSLSVEEQYYLLWSAFVVIALRRGLSRRALGWCAAAGALVVAILRYIAFVKGQANFAVLSTFTRPDSVLIGSALALLISDIPERARRVLGRPVVGVGIAAALVTTTFVVDWRDPAYPRGGASALNLMTALLIAHLVLTKGSIVHRFLSLRPFAGLGRVSYGLYLFHPVALYLVAGVPAERRGPGQFATYLLLTIVMTALSWVVVERPALRLKTRFGSMSRMPTVATADLSPAP